MGESVVFSVIILLLVTLCIALTSPKLHIALKTLIAIIILIPFAVFLGIDDNPFLSAFFCVLIIVSVGIIAHKIDKLAQKIDSCSKNNDSQ